MKQHLLIPVSALLICSTALAQNKTLVPIKNKAVANKGVTAKINYADAAVAPAGELLANPNPNKQLRSTSTTNLGTSTFQLQTNNSVQNRIVKNSDGTISAAFTFSALSTWSDRGTGYIYNNGTTWSAAPTARIESVRTGWPSMMVLGDNSEAVITHSTVSNNLHFSKRAVKGTGAFTHNSTIIACPFSYGSFWPRAVVGGATNNSIHMIAISSPDDGAATPAPVFYKGQQGCLMYSRSQDGGVTWDKLHTVIAQTDSTNYYGFGGDNYAIDAKGNTVAFVVGGEFQDLFLMKSTDNGTTWSKTIIKSFPIPFYHDAISDVNADAVADTITTNDGNVSLLIDDNGDVHVWVGAMRILDATAGDGLTTYFTGTDGLLYWNETMGASAPVIIAGMEDTDGDMAITITAFGTYFSSLTTQPSAGIDASGNIYLTYSSVVEYTDFGDGKSFRNVYMMSTSDHGTTWTTPARVSSDDFSEQVFCSVARNADPTCISMIYQSDIAPGVGFSSTSADYANNTGVIADEWYACVNTLGGVTETTNLTAYVGMFPNPANTQVSVNALNVIETVEVFNALGGRVLSISPNANNATLNVAGLTNGMYMVNVKTGGKIISKPLIKE